MQRLLLPLLLLASPLAAQDAPLRVEVGADVSYWQLIRGYDTDAARAAPSGTARAAVVIANRRPTSVGAALSYAREDDRSPGLLGITAEVTQRLFPPMEEGFNLFVTGGVGGLRLYGADGDDDFALDTSCPPPGCIHEGGPTVDEAWRIVATGGIGADVPLVRDVLLLQPTFSFIQPVREPKKLSREETMYRFGIGMAWRL